MKRGLSKSRKNKRKVQVFKETNKKLNNEEKKLQQFTVE